MSASPSLSLKVINDRLDLVSNIMQSPILHQNIIALLKRTFDSPRLLQKFSFGRGDADDLISVAKTIRLSHQIATLLRRHIKSLRNNTEMEKLSGFNDEPFAKILSRFNFEGSMQVATRILDSIDEEGLSEHHRLEENQIAETESTAEEVTDEADAEDSGTMSVQDIGSTIQSYATKPPLTNQNDGDVWITKKEYAKNDN